MSAHVILPLLKLHIFLTYLTPRKISFFHTVGKCLLLYNVLRNIFLHTKFCIYHWIVKMSYSYHHFLLENLRCFGTFLSLAELARLERSL
jgi:hypothetical protein